MLRNYCSPDKGAYLNFRKSSTCAHKLDYHIVIPTKYRKPIFSPEIADTTRSLIIEKCRDEGCILLGLSVQEDHLHLFIGLEPKHSVSRVIRKIKGYTTAKLRKIFRIEHKVWAGGYSAESLGFKNPAQIKAYIDRQCKHHHVEISPLIKSGDSRADEAPPR